MTSKIAFMRLDGAKPTNPRVIVVNKRKITIDADLVQIFDSKHLEKAREYIGKCMFSEKSEPSNVVQAVCKYYARNTAYDTDGNKLYPTEKAAIRRNQIEKATAARKKRKLEEGGTPPKKKPRRTKITPAAPKTTPAALEITPAAQEITPAALEIIPAALEITPAAPEITPAALEIAPAVPEITPAAQEITPAVPEIAPAAEDKAPESPGYTNLQQVMDDMLANKITSDEAKEILRENPQLLETVPEVMRKPFKLWSRA